MAVNNNTVQIIAGLLCTQLSAPPIGSAAITMSRAFTDGDAASDTYVALSTSPTNLNTALGSGNGYLMVNNPSAIDVVLKIGTTTIGTLKGVSATESGSVPALIPIDSGVVVTATAASGTPTVGVTLIKVTPNA